MRRQTTTSINSTPTLLGTEAMKMPFDPSIFSILIGSFNTYLLYPPTNTNLSAWLTHPSYTPDIVAIGLQELPLSVTLFEQKAEQQWKKLIEQTLPTYRFLSSIRMLRMILFIYVHANSLQHCSSVGTAKVTTGVMNLIGNKGAVGIRFNYGNHSLCFVNSHMSHGETLNDFQRRNTQFTRIHETMSFQSKENQRKSTYKINDHDGIFFFGDLNYRVRSTGEDELKQHSTLLKTYSEAPIQFPATYKYHPNTDHLNTKRRPSWTDRILYRTAQCCHLQSIDYWSPSMIRFSDHRPVASLLRFSRVLLR